MIALKDSLDSDFVERVRAIFAPDGLLAKARNFEYRPQQQDMAAAVAQTLEEERHLVVEAGTGVGKSLAYLVPATLFALEKKKKAIISTQTINLQEQLLHKDIPIVKKILPVEFEAALMKGRQNYLCPRRLERALQSANELFNSTEQADLARLADWARTTTDGTLSDLPIEPDPKVWTQVCSEAHLCTQKTCGQNPRCFFQQARRRLIAADVVVINHTLLFMLLGRPEEQEERDEGYLFPNDFIIFDEAHTIEQVASRQIGIGISQYGLRATIQRLYNARSKKGLFTVTRDAPGVTLAASLVDEADRFFAAIEERANFKKEEREYRVRERILSTIRSPDAWLRSRVASAKWSASPRTSSSKRSCRNWEGALAMRAKGSRSSCNRAPRSTFTGSSAQERRPGISRSTPRRSMSRRSCGGCFSAMIAPV
jgi:ATP-dependent DNA helicase DinG